MTWSVLPDAWLENFFRDGQQARPWVSHYVIFGVFFFGWCGVDETF
jgi:hypothetical protein